MVMVVRLVSVFFVTGQTNIYDGSHGSLGHSDGQALAKVLDKVMNMVWFT